MFDFGAHSCRAGFAGEDTPKVLLLYALHYCASKLARVIAIVVLESIYTSTYSVVYLSYVYKQVGAIIAGLSM